MNSPSQPKKSVRAVRIVFALLAGIILMPTVRAQPAPDNVDNRFLFIFSTSADMKKRVPAVQKSVSQLLAMSAQGELHSGDTIGVWTFDQDLRTGQFPLQNWDPQDAEMLASNLNKFVSNQHYGKTTSFGALQPLLGRVVENSERLTVLIFCDGDTDISGTAYDSGINKVFQQRRIEFKKARQPFVIALRAQLGQYTGCTVSFPPATVNLPKFPPWPPPPPAPKLTNAPTPPAVVPSLIIVGTKVGTNLPATADIPPPAPMITNPPPVAPPIITNAVPAPPTNFVTPANAVERTNATVLPAESSGASNSGALAIGAALLAVAGTLTILILRRARKADRSSLISRSMNEK
jgi:hypothetical protein